MKPVVIVLFLAVTMPIVYLLGPRPSISQMAQKIIQAKAQTPPPVGPGYHASSPIASALEHVPERRCLSPNANLAQGHWQPSVLARDRYRRALA